VSRGQYVIRSGCCVGYNTIVDDTSNPCGECYIRVTFNFKLGAGSSSGKIDGLCKYGN